MMATHWTKANINEAAEALKAGRVICFPTETVYGIAAISSSEEAFQELIKAKKRPPEKPITLMCSSVEQAEEYAVLEGQAKKIAERFMPGEITLLCKARNNLPWRYDFGSGVIGIRIPNDEFVLSLIKLVGEPLFVSSANISGMPAALNFEECLKYFGEDTFGIVEGSCVSKTPSTIVSLSDGLNLKCIREGSIPFKEIEDARKEAL